MSTASNTLRTKWTKLPSFCHRAFSNRSRISVPSDFRSGQNLRVSPQESIFTKCGHNAKTADRLSAAIFLSPIFLSQFRSARSSFILQSAFVDRQSLTRSRAHLLTCSSPPTPRRARRSFHGNLRRLPGPIAATATRHARYVKTLGPRRRASSWSHPPRRGARSHEWNISAD